MESSKLLAIWSRVALCLSMALALASAGMDARADAPAGPPPDADSLVAPAGVAWTETAWDLEVLRGIGAVHVVVLPVSPDGAAAGITRDALRADVEHRLRREGIEVLADADLLAARLAPEREVAALRVAFDDLKRDADPDGYHEFWLSFELWQEVQLVHRVGLKSPVATWARHATGTHRTFAMPGAVKDTMRESLDALVGDWRSVHGGTPGRALPLPVAQAAAAPRAMAVDSEPVAGPPVDPDPEGE